MTDIDLLGHSRLNIWQDVIPHQGLSLKLTWIKHLLDVYLEFEIVEIACDVVSVSDGKLTFALFSQVVHLHLKKKYNIFAFDGKIFLKVIWPQILSKENFILYLMAAVQLPLLVPGMDLEILSSNDIDAESLNFWFWLELLLNLYLMLS